MKTQRPPIAERPLDPPLGAGWVILNRCIIPCTGPRVQRGMNILHQRPLHITLLALALAGCQTIKPLPPTGRVIPCSTVDVVRPNVEAVDHMTDRVARQSLGNDLVIEAMCKRGKKK